MMLQSPHVLREFKLLLKELSSLPLLSVELKSSPPTLDCQVEHKPFFHFDLITTSLRQGGRTPEMQTWFNDN